MTDIVLPIPTLTTERLVLRSPEAKDFDAYASFRGSDRSKFVGGPSERPNSWQLFCALIGQWAMRGYGRWIVADKSSDEAMGIVGLHHPLEWPEPEIAWSLFAHAEGKGIAYEACRAARRFAYETLGWRTAISFVDPANTRSAALAQRLGCREERVWVHPVFGDMHLWRHPGPAEVDG